MTSDKKIQANNLGELKAAKKDIDFSKLNFEYIIKVKNNKLKYTKKPKSFIDKQKEFHQKLDKAKSVKEIKTALKDLYAQKN